MSQRSARSVDKNKDTGAIGDTSKLKVVCLLGVTTPVSAGKTMARRPEGDVNSDLVSTSVSPSAKHNDSRGSKKNISAPTALACLSPDLVD